MSEYNDATRDGWKAVGLINFCQRCGVCLDDVPAAVHHWDIASNLCEPCSAAYLKAKNAPPLGLTDLAAQLDRIVIGLESGIVATRREELTREEWDETFGIIAAIIGAEVRHVDGKPYGYRHVLSWPVSEE